MQAICNMYLTPLCSDRGNGPIWDVPLINPYTGPFVDNILLKHPQRLVLLHHMVRIQLLVARYATVGSRDRTWEEGILPAGLLSQLRADRMVVVAFAVCTPDKKRGVLFVDYIESLWEHQGFAAELMCELRKYGEHNGKPIVIPRNLPTGTEHKDLVARSFWRSQFGDECGPETIRQVYEEIDLLEMEGLEIFLETFWEEEDRRHPERSM